MYAIGNGESRIEVNIDQLNGEKVGCNAILRDYTVEHLVCCDRRMVEEAVNLGYNKHSYVYTREDWIKQFSSYPRIRPVPTLPYQGSERWDEPIHWGSGPYAVLLAAKLSKDKQVQLLGFDLHSKDRLVNNVYKGTKNYADPSSHSIDPRYWIIQISKIFHCFKNHKFTIYQNNDWILPAAWIQPNVSLDRISNIYYNI